MTEAIAAPPAETEAEDPHDGYQEEIKCPWSNHMIKVHIPPKKSADEFCPHCDFPLFWSYRTNRSTADREWQLAVDAAAANTGTPVTRVDQSSSGSTPAATPEPVFSCRRCTTDNPVSVNFCSQCGEPRREPKTSAWPWQRILPIAALVLLVIALAVLYGFLL